MAENEILTSEQSFEGEENKSCLFCLKEPAKYTCPRCNKTYCSVDCYRSEKHKNCSEMFYRDCFMQGLEEMHADPEEKRKMLNMLKRAQADPDLSDLDDPGDDLEERLAGLDLEKDSDKIWNRLTDQERKEFEQMAGDGRLGNLVEPWKPWWCEQSPLVTEVDSPVSSRSENALPRIKSDIPNISQVLKSKPSAEVKFNIINVLFAYCYICHHYNGEHVAMGTESAEDMLLLCDVLGQGLSCGSVEEAIQPGIRGLTCNQNKFDSSPEFNVSVIYDVECIVTGSGDDGLLYVMAALSDIHQIFKKAYKASGKVVRLLKSPVNGQNKQEKSKLFHICKKCEFYLSWAQTYGMALVRLVPELEIVKTLLSAELEAVNQSKKKLEGEWKGKVMPKKKTLVEEI